jgi:hypothetical protein
MLIIPCGLDTEAEGVMRKVILVGFVLASVSGVCRAQKPYPTEAQESAASTTFTAALPKGSAAQIRETLKKAHAAIDTAEALDFGPFDKDARQTASDRIKGSKDIFNELYDYGQKMLDTNQFSTATLYVFQHDAIAIAVNMGQIDNLYRAQLLLDIQNATTAQLNTLTTAFDAANGLQTDADGWTLLLIGSMRGDNSTFVALNEKSQACTAAFTARSSQ